MDGHRRLAQVFVELADTLVESFDSVDFLQMLTDRCVELLAADAASLLLADERGALRWLAVSPEGDRLLELLELDPQEGPGQDCFATGRTVPDIDLDTAHDQWPAFAPAAVQAGFARAHAFPMRLRTRVIGALTLFTERAQPWDDERLAVGQAMADIATIGLLQERTVHEQTVLAGQLQKALDSRVLIEQAKGVLAARAGVSVSEAFTRMRAHARGTGLTLTSVASAVVSGSLDRSRLGL
jgi:ANTAR domain-containing protein/GAF domain-containing protein